MVIVRENPNLKWMRTGGTPMTKRKPPYASICHVLFPSPTNVLTNMLLFFRGKSIVLETVETSLETPRTIHKTIHPMLPKHTKTICQISAIDAGHSECPCSIPNMGFCFALVSTWFLGIYARDVRFLSHGVPPVIIHVMFGFSLINYPAIGYPHFQVQLPEGLWQVSPQKRPESKVRLRRWTSIYDRFYGIIYIYM